MRSRARTLYLASPQPVVVSALGLLLSEGLSAQVTIVAVSSLKGIGALEDGDAVLWCGSKNDADFQQLLRVVGRQRWIIHVPLADAEEGVSGCTSAPLSTSVDVWLRTVRAALRVPATMQAPDAPSMELLGKREREVFRYLVDGLPNRTIAAKLKISPRTVETHRARILRKLDCASNAELVRFAVRHRLLAEV